MGRFIGIALGVLVLFWIISSPATAAATVNQILATLASMANSITTYVQHTIA
ncbi:MAG TPA: hypothetical protein VFE65_27475 [Pseudonocardia sp.]|nr:hypothetical protein [Pseudonocardia sp.]